MARPGISTKNTEKKKTGVKFQTPKIYPQNTPKVPKNTRKMPILGIFRGSRISAGGGYFFGIFGGNSGGASRSSVAHRGVLRTN